VPSIVAIASRVGNAVNLGQVSGAAGDSAKKDLERKIKKIGMTLVQVSAIMANS
jgi:hypothetical protein